MPPRGEGVFAYDGQGRWTRLTSLSYGTLREGLNILYFRNNWCASCAVFDLKVPDIVELYSCRASMFIISCTWFTSMCLDTAARRAFMAFKVKDSPTLIFVEVKDGAPVRELRVVGALSLSELKKYILANLHMQPCKRAARGRGGRAAGTGPAH